MHFLCLHGAGTNSRIFESQTAALRYELGDHHTYEFVEGTIPCEMAPEVHELASPKDEFFQYIDEGDLSTCVAMLVMLDAYIAAEGPFDAVLAFSQGAMVAATYIAWRARKYPKLERISPVFKCAIFLSATDAYDETLLVQGQARALTLAMDGEAIAIPSVHAWGHNDRYASQARNLSEICDARIREIYIHEGGHEIPGTRSSSAVKAVVRLIRRIVSHVTYREL